MEEATMSQNAEMPATENAAVTNMSDTPQDTPKKPMRFSADAFRALSNRLNSSTITPAVPAAANTPDLAAPDLVAVVPVAAANNTTPEQIIPDTVPIAVPAQDVEPIVEQVIAPASLPEINIAESLAAEPAAAEPVVAPQTVPVANVNVPDLEMLLAQSQANTTPSLEPEANNLAHVEPLPEPAPEFVPELAPELEQSASVLAETVPIEQIAPAEQVALAEQAAPAEVIPPVLESAEALVAAPELSATTEQIVPVDLVADEAFATKPINIDPVIAESVIVEPVVPHLESQTETQSAHQQAEPLAGPVTPVIRPAVFLSLKFHSLKSLMSLCHLFKRLKT